MNDTNKLSPSIIISFISATALHTLLAGIILYFDLNPLTEKDKTIPFLLISTDRKSTISNQNFMSKAENSQAAQEYLASLNASTFQVTKQQKNNKKISKKDTKSNREKQNTDAPQIPSTSSSKQANSTSSSNYFQGLKDIFSTRKDSPIKSNRQQISSKSADLLSPYEIALLEQLKTDVLYDGFHSVMKANEKKSIDYIVTLTLLPNGAIKNAKIKRSSGLNKIDRLAKQAAYRASPFPTPPKGDFVNEYKYDIPISYQPFKEQ